MIDDSTIANLNQHFLNRVGEVVCDSFELGLPFVESENQLCQFTKHILHNN